MRRGDAALALLAAVAGIAAVAPAAGADIDPVRLTVTAPDVVAARAPLSVRVRVDTDPGALDTRDGPVRLQVRLAPECGGSFIGTSGPTVIDALLRPQPAAGASYSAAATGTTHVSQTGTLTVCAFLDDSEDRQFATDTDTQVEVSRPRATTRPRHQRARVHRRARGHSRPRARHHRRRAARFTG